MEISSYRHLRSHWIEADPERPRNVFDPALYLSVGGCPKGMSRFVWIFVDGPRLIGYAAASFPVA